MEIIVKFSKCTKIKSRKLKEYIQYHRAELRFKFKSSDFQAFIFKGKCHIFRMLICVSIVALNVIFKLEDRRVKKLKYVLELLIKFKDNL